MPKSASLASVWSIAIAKDVEIGMKAALKRELLATFHFSIPYSRMRLNISYSFSMSILKR